LAARLEAAQPHLVSETLAGISANQPASVVERLPPVFEAKTETEIVLVQAEEPQPAPLANANLQLVKPLSDAAPLPTTPRESPRTLELPKGLPGAQAPPLMLPPYDPANPQKRQSVINQIFPNLPQLPPEVQAMPGPGGQSLQLNDLLAMGLNNHPAIRQAIADITAARGNAIQVGTPMNPNVGYEADTVGSQYTANYHGMFFEQLFKTGGKLQLAQASALTDVRNAELALRKARIGLITQIQARYYAVLVAEEAVHVTQALAHFTDQAYIVQREQLKGGEAAAYEPMQLRVLAMQARAALAQARNRYYSAWKQLAATLNTPTMPPTRLSGDLTTPVPAIRFDLAQDRMLRTHTDIQAAQVDLLQSQLNLRLAEVTPIPDFNLYSAIQKDYTGPPFGVTWNMQAGLRLPIWDKNVGGILNAQGMMSRQQQQIDVVRNGLVSTLADAFERYENNRAILEYYRTQILPDQARAYRGVYERHQQQPDRVTFGDVITAQQTLANTITNYIVALGNQWTAVTDLLNVLQVESLDELRATENVPPPQPQNPLPAPVQ
jgi:cobalt-zinc-cadmium efflux system outer membrane protein